MPIAGAAVMLADWPSAVNEPEAGDAFSHAGKVLLMLHPTGQAQLPAAPKDFVCGVGLLPPCTAVNVNALDVGEFRVQGTCTFILTVTICGLPPEITPWAS